MQVFTNKFSIAMNQEKTEVIVNFFQNMPIIPLDATNPDQANVVREMSSEVIPVANLIMTGQCAQNFVKTLSSMLSQPSTEE